MGTTASPNWWGSGGSRRTELCGCWVGGQGMRRGAGGELALGSLSSAPGNTCPKVSGIAGAPSWGP